MNFIDDSLCVSMSKVEHLCSCVYSKRHSAEASGDPPPERAGLQPGLSPGLNMETHEKQRSRGREQLLIYVDLAPVSRPPARDSLVKKNINCLV